jgi:hypothetical protein
MATILGEMGHLFPENRCHTLITIDLKFDGGSEEPPPSVTDNEVPQLGRYDLIPQSRSHHSGFP